MAILKHIASKSSNYGAALEYLIFKHDELRKTPILDQNGNRIMRDEFYLDGLNCEPYSFDAACQQLNREYQKNKNKRNADMNSGRVMNLRVTIPAESRRLNVGKDVIRILGSPAYICVLQRKDRKSIAITPCAAEHPMSFKVPDRLLTDGQCRMMINGIQFIQVLLEANGLAAGKDHQFKGRYDAEKNAVVISLEENEFENECQSKIGLNL